ncbi:MAG: IS21 family transposase [Acidimicrobiia bacterium]
MARPRVETHRLRELVRLRRLGASGREVVRLLRLSPKTERRYRAVLGDAGLLEGSAHDLPTLAEVRAAVEAGMPRVAPTPSTVEPWRERVEELLDKGLSARAVYDRIRLDERGGRRRYRGSYSAVKRFVRRLRRERGAQPEDVAVPIPTRPGEAAQIDFGYAGRLYDPARGVVRRAWVFVLLCVHSRVFFARLVFDQTTETWLDLHEQAFRALGGVPAILIPDNTTRAVLRAAFGIDGPTELERSYRELGERYGFKVDPAPPGDPRKRGKVEATVRYLRGNPLKSRDGDPIDEVQADLDLWNREVASVRVHGTTGRRPSDVFEQEERAALLPLPTDPAERAVWKHAKVHPDSHVTCRGRLFSVPWQLIHERVWVRACAARIEVFQRDRSVAVHLDRGRWRTTLEEHLPQDRSLLRHRSRAFWESRARRIGPETLGLVQAAFDQDPVLSHLRQVQAIVKHLEQFPRVRAELASQRARASGDFSYGGIKRTLAEGLDLTQSGAHAEVRGPVEQPPTCHACGAHQPDPLRAHTAEPSPHAALRPTGS